MHHLHLHFRGRDHLFATLQLWFPPRSRLGAPVAGWLCPQRDCVFLLWLRRIIYGHHAGGDQQTDSLRTASSLSIKGFSGMFPTSWFSACEWQKNAWSSQPSPQLCPSDTGFWFRCPLGWLEISSVSVTGILVWHRWASSFGMQREPASAVHLLAPSGESNFCWLVFEVISSRRQRLMLMGTRSQFCTGRESLSCSRHSQASHLLWQCSGRYSETRWERWGTGDLTAVQFYIFWIQRLPLRFN